ncbi:MAG: hypothetical protein WCQ44_08290 [Opitutaceae bacterium]|jgi:hypothetical protein
MAESIPPTPRPLNGSIRPATAVITVITATIILANIVVVTTAVPLA